MEMGIGKHDERHVDRLKKKDIEQNLRIIKKAKAKEKNIEWVSKLSHQTGQCLHQPCTIVINYLCFIDAGVVKHIQNPLAIYSGD